MVGGTSRAGATTLLFFDDHPLNRRDNVARRVGRPALIPESVYRDPLANTAWGYPTVFRDPTSGVWRLLYTGIVAGDRHLPLVAESDDGLRWCPRDTTAELDLPDRHLPNQVALPLAAFGEWSQPFIDERAPADERLKGLVVSWHEPVGPRTSLWVSRDGLRWTPKDGVRWQAEAPDPPTSAFWNPLRASYTLSSRPSVTDRRIALCETRDWRSFSEPRLAMATDALDTPLAEVYGMPVFPYDRYFVALLWLYHVAPQVEGQSAHTFRDGRVDCQLAYSLDGRYFQRGPRAPFIATGEPNQPHHGCVYPTALLALPDGSLRIYAGASVREHGYRDPGLGAIVAFSLRRDGFVYLESAGGRGTVGTRPLLWRGGEMELNAQSPGGAVRVQITDIHGAPLEGFAFEDCAPFRGDDPAWRPAWTSGVTMGTLAGRPLRVEVELTSARLYALRGDLRMLTAFDSSALAEQGQAPPDRPGFP